MGASGNCAISSSAAAWAAVSAAASVDAMRQVGWLLGARLSRAIVSPFLMASRENRLGEFNVKSELLLCRSGWLQSRSSAPLVSRAISAHARGLRH